MNFRLFLPLIAASACLAAGTALAQTWPSKPVRIVVSYPPGGGADTVARLLSPKLAESLGQPVLVENRGGAGGQIGGEAVAKSPPDGYTLMLDASNHGQNPGLYPKMPFDTLRDFAPVSLLVRVPNLLVVYPGFSVKSVQELIALARAKPGSISFASSGSGSAQHLAAELFRLRAGLDMVHIPYKGGGPALTDVMGGQVPIFFGNMASALPHVRSGKLRALAMTGRTRSPNAPEIPTVAESGVPGYEMYEWNGVFAPAGTPDAILDRLSVELGRALNQPDVKARLASLGAEIVGSTPKELEQFRRTEIEKWTKVIREAGIKVE